MPKRLVCFAVFAMILVDVFYGFCVFAQENAGMKKTWLTEIVSDLQMNKQNLTIQLKKAEGNIAVAENIIAQARAENNRAAEAVGKQALSAAKQAKKKAQEAIRQAEKKTARIRQRLSNLVDSDLEISAVITGYSGDVVYYSKRLGKELPLSELPIACLEDGDVIRTKAGGHVQMYCFEGRGNVEIGENTMLAVRNNNGDSVLDLAVGQINLKVKKIKKDIKKYLKEYFKVYCPTVAVAVRGTEFSVLVRESKATDIIVFEGIVEVEDINAAEKTVKAVVESGHRVHITAQGDVQEIQKGTLLNCSKGRCLLN